MEKPDFEALVKNISTEEWDYDLAIAGTSPSGRFSCGKEDVIELLEHAWNTHVVPLESENKSLQEKLKIAEHLKELADDAIVTLQKEVEKLKADNESLLMFKLYLD